MRRPLLPVLAASLAAASLVLAALPVAAASLTDRYSSFLVFGDSLSDPGNLYAATGGAVPPSPPYADGRFSNGPVWAESLTAQFLAAGEVGANFAFGGARAQTDADAVPDFAAQIDLLDASGLTPALGARPLAAVWFGANDLFDGIAGGVVAATVSAVAAVVSVAQGIARLQSDYGVEDFVVFNLPDLGRTPLFNLFQPAGQPLASAATGLFNLTLDGAAGAIPGATITEIDISALFDSLFADPSAFGVSDVTLPCVFPTQAAADAFGQPLVCDAATAEQRAFFDQVHPNDLLHRAIAAEVRGALAAVPVPATLPLLLTALAFAASAGRRSRRAVGSRRNHVA